MTLINFKADIFNLLSNIFDLLIKIWSDLIKNRSILIINMIQYDTISSSDFESDKIGVQIWTGWNLNHRQFDSGALMV